MLGGALTPVLITGANGQVGTALATLWGKAATLATRTELDLSKPETIALYLDQHKPKLVLNAAAYTQVDRAEEEVELALQINAESVKAMADWCAANDAWLVHYSTDYVFDGSGERSWKEEDVPAPLNTYGRTKLAGEAAIIASGAKHIILRTSWVYDGQGKNFLTTMARLMREREVLSVVSDQVGAPTYAPHLAEATWQIVEAIESGEGEAGIYHCCHQGEASWHGFAEAILKRLPNAQCQSITPIRSSDWPTPATRPHNSRLNCDKLERAFGVRLPKWEHGLDAAFRVLDAAGE